MGEVRRHTLGSTPRRRMRRGRRARPDVAQSPPLLGLQANAGNTAVARLVESAIQREPAVAEPPVATDRPLLKEGAQSDDVIQLKMELNVAGADPPVRMGKDFDAETKKAVIAFQSSHRLEPDGDVGPKTWGMLDAIGRDRVSDKDEMAAVRVDMTKADALADAGDWAGAREIFKSVYARPTMVPEVRAQVAWNLGSCEHHLGNFDAAASWYQEYLDAPGIDALSRRDADQRLRECRLKQAPGKVESSVTEERSEQAKKDLPEATDRSLLKEGAQGDEVVQLKMELNVAGADPPVPVDGTFEATTKKAVIAFQKAHNLEPDGDVGPKTWGMLDAIGRDRVSSKAEMDEVRTGMAAAEKAREAGDFVGAAALYLTIYKLPTLVPEIRAQVAWALGACEHNLGHFDEAASWYQEYLDAPGVDALSRRDADQRLRECRLKQPPGKTESTLTSERDEQAKQDRPEATDRRLLKEGAQGDDVVQMKMELNVAGADPPVPMNGTFDPAAKTSLIAFQSSHGLEPDGECGPKTWGMLDAIGRDRVTSKEDMDAVRAKMTAADKLLEAKEWAAAKPLYLEVYSLPTMVPEVRAQVAWDLGACEHHLGNFDAAASWYQEYLEAPSIDALSRRDADQRLRECRLELPPGRPESAITDERSRAATGG